MSVCNRGHSATAEITSPSNSLAVDKLSKEVGNSDNYKESESTRKSSDGDDLSFLLDEPDNSVDPYSIDIYSYYGNNSNNTNDSDGNDTWSPISPRF